MRFKCLFSMSLVFALIQVTSFGGGILEVLVPTFDVRDITLEEGLKELRKMGLLVCFEELPSEDLPPISLRLKNTSVKEIFITVPFPLHCPSCFVILSEDSPRGNPHHPTGTVFGFWVKIRKRSGEHLGDVVSKTDSNAQAGDSRPYLESETLEPWIHSWRRQG